MTGTQVIVLAMPVFLLAIALEFAIGRARGRNTYRLNDTLGSLGLGVMSQVFEAFGTLFKVAMYTLVFLHLALIDLLHQFWVHAQQVANSAGSTAGSAAPAAAAPTMP